MKPLRVVCFDLDATLVHIRRDEYQRLVDTVYDALVAKHPGLDKAELHRVNTKLGQGWRAWDENIPAGASGLALMRSGWAECLAACGCDEPELGDFAFELYWELSHAPPYVFWPFEDAIALLESLRGRYRLAVITNGPRDTQVDKLQVCGLEPYFDVIVASGDLGAPKPSVAIFEHTLRLLGTSPDEALHVGDHLSADVAGARAAGLRAVWLNRDGATRREGDAVPDVEITSLAELGALIGSAR